MRAKRAVGIDGCPGGWVAAGMGPEGLTWSSAAVPDIARLVTADAVTAIDMPIGLVARGRRACDDEARAALPGASSRVFTTPPRAVLELGPAAPNAQAQARARELMGTGVSRQALHLAPRILVLDAHLSANPGLIAVEVHPELSFAELSGRVLDRKRSPAGVEQRLEALTAWLPHVRDAITTRPRGVPLVDALDALAALWSAVRWRDGAARTLPPHAEARPFIAV